jgi:putative ABC transport system permease protein
MSDSDSDSDIGSGMTRYYFALALRSLRRNLVLTVLMIAAIGVGIGASMTTLTVFRAMSADPIPQKSRQLFAPQIDNWGPDGHGPGEHGDKLRDQIDYIDAAAFMNAHVAPHQTATYAVSFGLTPADRQLKPFKAEGRAAYSDFFSMFDVPFQYGAPWSAADDEGRAPVVVISQELNDRVFGGANSVGRTINLDNEDYRISGVLKHWQPMPRFYDVTNDPFSKSEQVFLPFTRAIDRHMSSDGSTNCSKAADSGWEGTLRSNCVWIQYWVELPTRAAANDYRRWLSNYAAEQQRTGRFQWPGYTKLRDLREWLSYEHVVRDEARILVLVSFSFLFVCLLNAMGLMLAKFMGRAADIGVRRALGANRRAILTQCLIEAGVIGLAGGVLGLALTGLGLVGLRSVLSEEILELTHLDLAGVGIALGLAIVATVMAGLYPTWRAAQVQPAWQLKAQ